MDNTNEIAKKLVEAVQNAGFDVSRRYKAITAEVNSARNLGKSEQELNELSKQLVQRHLEELRAPN